MTAHSLPQLWYSVTVRSAWFRVACLRLRRLQVGKVSERQVTMSLRGCFCGSHVRRPIGCSSRQRKLNTVTQPCYASQSERKHQSRRQQQGARQLWRCSVFIDDYHASITSISPADLTSANIAPMFSAKFPSTRPSTPPTRPAEHIHCWQSNANSGTESKRSAQTDPVSVRG